MKVRVGFFNYSFRKPYVVRDGKCNRQSRKLIAIEEKRAKEDLAQPLSARNILKPLAAIKLKESLDRYDINRILMCSSNLTKRRKLFELPLYIKVLERGENPPAWIL